MEQNQNKRILVVIIVVLVLAVGFAVTMRVLFSDTNDFTRVQSPAGN